MPAATNRIPAHRTAKWLGLLGSLALLGGCGRSEKPTSAAKPPGTPDPREQALIERTVRERLAQEDRATEQALVNARAAASQRRIGVQMFRDLEEQYRQRQAAMADAAPESTPVPEQTPTPAPSPQP